MAQKHINTSTPNDNLGDTLRDANIKCEDNFTELYANKVDKISGKGLSTNDYTTADKAKLEGIPADAEKNVQADFLVNDPDSDAYIKNKPNLITSVNWGDIQGDIANQYDLQNALDQKPSFAYVDGKISQTVLSGITDFAPSEDAVFNGLVLKQNISEKNLANGYAGLDAGGKILTSQLPNSVMEYKGVYNAATNTPILVNGTGNTGDVYRVTVSGTGVNSLNFVVGDYVVYNGTTWEKQHSGSDNVVSVFGRAGVITAQTGDYTTAQVTETTNRNFQTDSQKLYNDATSSIQTQINSKEFVISTGLNSQYWRGDKSWQTLDKTAVGLGNVDNTADSTKNVLSATKLTTARTINGVAFDGTANIIINATDSVPRLALSGGTLTGGLTGTTGTFTGVLTAPTAPAGTNTTQVATTAYVQANSVGGTGTTNYISKFVGAGVLGNANIYDNGNVGIGTVSPVGKLNIAVGDTNTFSPVTQGDGTLSIGNAASGAFTPLIAGKSSNGVGLYLAGLTTDANANPDIAFNVRTTANSDFSLSAQTSPAYRFSRFGTILMDINRNGNTNIGNLTASDAKLNVAASKTGTYTASLASPNLDYLRVSNVHNAGGADQFATIMLQATGNNGANNAYAGISVVQPTAGYSASDISLTTRQAGGAMTEVFRANSTGNAWINSDASYGTSKLNLSSTGGVRLLEVNREDGTVTSGITGGAGMCLSTVPFANGVGGVFGNNVLGYMRNPLESIGIRGAVVPLSDTGTEPIIKIEANSSTTNAFSGIKFVDTRPVLGVYNYTSSLFRVMATGAVGMGAGLQSPNYNLHVHANATSNYMQFTSTNTGTANTDGLVLGVATNSEVQFINRENTPITFHTNNTEKVRIAADGKFLVNRTGDDGTGAVLQSNGSISTSGNMFVTGNIAATSYSGGATLTGAPTAPTATVGANTTQIATTAFVQSSLNSKASLAGSNTFTGTNNFSGGIVVVADPVSAYHAVPKNYVDSNFQPKLGYKVYTATLNQSGTAAPVPTIMDNSIGSIVWTRTGVGTYRGTLSAAFTTGKTTVFLNPAFGTGNVNAAQWITTSTIDVKTLNGLSPTDGILSTDIEIRVYN